MNILKKAVREEVVHYGVTDSGEQHAYR